MLLLIGGGVAAYLLTRPKKTLVPYVVYLQLPTAQSRIQDAGFTPNVIPETSNYPVERGDQPESARGLAREGRLHRDPDVLHRAGLDHRADGRVSSPGAGDAAAPSRTG